jgi:predicted phage terminase large subunit-like protein
LAQIRAEKARREAERQRRDIEQNAELIRGRCGTLAGFVREAWKVLEPNQPLVWNWHLDALCAHLEAITDGRINRLLANVPPGSSKSLTVSVMWQAWEWGPKGLLSMRYLATAFNDGPVKRDTRKCRDLIRSSWYQSLWPEVDLTRTGETSFANSGTGTREGVAFGSLTSQRGDRLIIDDPHSTETAESPTERQNTTRKFREGATNRLNDQERSAIVVIMQRLHDEDISGTILKLGMGYVHLNLPMEFEAERACSTVIGFTDPRSADGDLLDPVRFPRSVVEKLKRDMGSYAYAGQYQQRPAPREGGIFQRKWFGYLPCAPAGTRFVRGWDLAASTEKDSAYTAGVKIGKMPDGAFLIANAVRNRLTAGGVERLMVNTAGEDGKSCLISLPQDPGQAGKAQSRYLVKKLAGFNARKSPESGDKVTRAEPLSAQAEAGNVYILKTGDAGKDAWIEPFLDELCIFPNGKYLDQTDASSRAFNELTGRIGTRTVSTAAPRIVPNG